jgi:two-component system sensor histidine kinase CpxA
MTLTVAGVAGLFALWSERSWEERMENVVLGHVRVARDFTENLMRHGVAWDEIERSLAPMLAEEALTLTIVRADGTEVRHIGRPDPPRDLPVPEAAARAIRSEGRWIQFGHGPPFSAGLPIALAENEPGLFYVSGGRERWGPHAHGGRFLAGLAVILGLAWLLCWPLASHLSRPLRKLAQASDALGRGNLDARVSFRRRDEIGVLARSFNAMAENLQRLVASHKQLLADVSHELRSPLARLQVALELARQDAGADSRTYLETAQRQSDALDGLIGELLTHARLEASQAPLQRGPIELGPWLEALRAAHQAQAEARGIQLDLSVPPGLPTLSADRRLLERAVGNVLRNALAYSAEGTAVTVRAERAGQDVILSVRDHGPGVDPALLERIFEPFFRVDSHRARLSGGVGLGLAIARRSLEAHGGRVWAENAPDGQGLVVRLSLPLSPPA